MESLAGCRDCGSIGYHQPGLTDHWHEDPRILVRPTPNEQYVTLLGILDDYQGYWACAKCGGRVVIWDPSRAPNNFEPVKPGYTRMMGTAPNIFRLCLSIDKALSAVRDTGRGYFVDLGKRHQRKLSELSAQTGRLKGGSHGRRDSRG